MEKNTIIYALQNSFVYNCTFTKFYNKYSGIRTSYYCNRSVALWTVSNIAIGHWRNDNPVSFVLFDVAPKRVSPDKTSIADRAIEVWLTDGFYEGNFLIFFGFILAFFVFCLLFFHCVNLLWVSLIHMARKNGLCFCRVGTIIAFMRSAFFMLLYK